MFETRAQYRRIWLQFVLLLMFAGVAAGSSRAQIRATGVVDLDGHAVDPFQRAAGKIVVLLFVRTDCPISNRYAPSIQQMSARFEKSAEFFLVYPIESESSEAIRKHLKEYGYKLTALRDPQHVLIRAANATITPESAVFSANGQLRYHGRIDDWYTEFGRSRPAPTTHELSSAVEAASLGKPIAVATAPAVGCFLPGAP
jgi:thiol-disulfide isomerase/thioredoxin